MIEKNTLPKTTQSIPTREIWLVPPGSASDHRSELIDECRGRKYIYITASSHLANQVKLKAAPVADRLHIFTFQQFVRWMTENVIYTEGSQKNKAPLPKKRLDVEPIPALEPLLAQLVRKLSADSQLTAIQPQNLSKGSIDSITNLLGEIARAGLSAEEYYKNIQERQNQNYPELTSNQENQKLEEFTYEIDIATVYRAYEQILITHEWAESNYDYIRAIKILEGELDGTPCRLHLAHNDFLIIDGFFNFTPAQAKILFRLIPRIPNIRFLFEYDDENPIPYRLVFETVEKISHSIPEFVVRKNKPLKSTGKCINHNPTLIQLARTVFQPEKPDLIENQNGIVAFEASNQDYEVHTCAKNIKKLILKQNIKPADIAVVVRSMDAYLDPIKRIFALEQIVCDISSITHVLDIPAIRAMVKLLEALASRKQQDTAEKPSGIPVKQLLEILKSRYFSLENVSNTQVDEIENVVYFVGKSLPFWKWLNRAKKLAQHQESKEQKEQAHITSPKSLTNPSSEDLSLLSSNDLSLLASFQLDEVDHDSQITSPLIHPGLVTKQRILDAIQVLNTLDQILGTIPYEASALVLSQKLESVFETLHLDKTLRDQTKNANLEELRRVAVDLRGRQSFAAACEAIQIAHQAFDPQPAMTLPQLKEDLVRTLKTQNIFGFPPLGGAVRVLTASEISYFKFKYVFCLGLVENEFPALTQDDWIYSSSKREAVKLTGLVLEDKTAHSLLKDEYYFANILNHTTECLYLSWYRRAFIDGQEREVNPSYFVQEIIQRLTPKTFLVQYVQKNYFGGDLTQISTRLEALRSLVTLSKNSAFFQESWSLLTKLGWVTKNLDLRLAVEDQRNSLSFNKYDGRLTPDRIQSVLFPVTGVLEPLTASEVNQYGKCPYKFFSETILQLKPRVEAALDLQRQHRGALIHAILRDLFTQYNHSQLLRRSKSEIGDLLEAVGKKTLHRFEYNLLPLNKKLWEIEKNAILSHLRTVVESELEILKKSSHSIQSSRHELAFGLNNSTPLKVEFENGEFVLLKGRLDRLDQHTDGSLIAYDYKSGRGSTKADMMAGRDVQLGVYLEAIDSFYKEQNQFVAGGGYYLVGTTIASRRSSGCYMSGYHDLVGLAKHNQNIMEIDEFNEFRAQMRKNIQKNVSGIRKADFKVCPSNPDTTCRSCEFQNVCRIEKNRIGKKVKELLWQTLC